VRFDNALNIADFQENNEELVKLSISIFHQCDQNRIMNILIISQNAKHSRSLYRIVSKKLKPFFDEIQISTMSDPRSFTIDYDKSDIDIIITDIVMSGKNGLDIITETKSTNPDISIIAITETSGIPGKFHYMPIAKMLGADHAIENPIDPTRFAGIVLGLIELKLSQLAA
jgi:DNA-binding NtrC family response regulator